MDERQDLDERWLLINHRIGNFAGKYSIFNLELAIDAMKNVEPYDSSVEPAIEILNNIIDTWVALRG